MRTILLGLLGLLLPAACGDSSGGDAGDFKSFGEPCSYSQDMCKPDLFCGQANKDGEGFCTLLCSGRDDASCPTLDGNHGRCARDATKDIWRCQWDCEGQEECPSSLEVELYCSGIGGCRIE